MIWDIRGISWFGWVAVDCEVLDPNVGRHEGFNGSTGGKFICRETVNSSNVMVHIFDGKIVAPVSSKFKKIMWGSSA